MAKVYLVGAGPGDPGLLTMTALKVLRRADVVLYDRLVNRRIFELLPRGIRKVYVGAGSSDPQNRQKRIDRLMLKNHEKGLTVVRLKNGDPFLFGRGGEELQFLRKNRIPFEVVPGVTSAVGVPSRVGLPLTHRQLSSAVMVISGHPAEGSATDWSKAAKFHGTLVILMGVGAVRAVCRRLIGGGKDPSTPACMISRGTLKGERVVSGRLDELGRLVVRMKLRPPAVAVVGEVVRLADFWKDDQRLR